MKYLKFLKFLPKIVKYVFKNIKIYYNPTAKEWAVFYEGKDTRITEEMW